MANKASFDRPLRVFLCHASNDKPKVRKLYRRLVTDGIDAWFDEEKLLPGQDWQAEIPKAVKNSDVVLVCFSKSSLTKEGYVQKEIRLALDVAEEKPVGTIFLIPIRLEECDIIDSLGHLQWLDLFLQENQIDNEAYEKLIKSLRARSNQRFLTSEIKYGNEDEYEEFEQETEKFEPNESAFLPPRAWILPIPRVIFEPHSLHPISSDYAENYALRIESLLQARITPAQVIEIDRGPRLTRFSLEPLLKDTDEGRVRVRITELESAEEYLANNLRVKHLKITNQTSRYNCIAVDIENERPDTFSLLEILESDVFQKQQGHLKVILGREVSGQPLTFNLANLPNILISGKTSSGISTCLDGILASLLVNNSPNELQLVLIDVRRVEFAIYSQLPHLLSPALSSADGFLLGTDWLIHEAKSRYRLFSKTNTRNIQEYNRIAPFDEKLPYIIVFVAELADLMQSLSEKVKKSIVRLISMSRFSGIQMVLATHIPSNEIISDEFKRYCTNRIALTMASSIDSKVIVDQPGAEKLLGWGDMLYMSNNMSDLIRLQGTLVSQKEVSRLVNFWHKQIF